MNPRPIETALLICTLFCLPRIVIPGRPVPDTVQIMIRIPAEGLSKEQVHNSIQGLVEEELRTLTEQIHLESESSQAELLVAVKFNKGTPVPVCISRIQQIMSRVQNRLPYQASRPIITPLPSEPPFLKLFFSLKPQSEALRNLELTQLQEQLQMNPNIQRVLVHGYSPRRIVIRLDPEKLARQQISPLYIQQHLQQSLFHFYSGVRPEANREIGVEMQSSIADIADLKQLALPIPRSSGMGTHIIRLQELASVERQNLVPSHYIAASGFNFGSFNFGSLNYGDGHSTADEGEWRGVGISIQTSHNLQLFQQLMLFRFIRKAVRRTDSVEAITFSGGTYFSVIGAVVLLCAFFAAGLLLSAFLTSTLTSLGNGTIFLYMLSWALMLGWHTLLQIPISPSRCIGICVAVPGIITLLAAGTRPWMKQIVDLCVITLAAAAVIIGLGIALHGIVDGALQREISNSLSFHPPLLKARPSTALFSTAPLAYAQVLQELCWFLSWGILLSGLNKASHNRRSLATNHSPLIILNNLIAPFVLIALFAAPLLILPCHRSYSLQNIGHPQHACLALSAHFRSRFPTASFSAGVPQYSQIERCSTATEYWELRVNPQQIRIDCLMSPLTALHGLSSLGSLGSNQRQDSNGGQSMQPLRFSLKIKQRDSPFAVASHHELHSHLQLSVTGNKVGSLPDTRSISARVPVHLYYGRTSTLNELTALPIFIDSSCVRLGELCDITSITESEAQ